jgi:hypothetical protein
VAKPAPTIAVIYNALNPIIDFISDFDLIKKPPAQIC